MEREPVNTIYSDFFQQPTCLAKLDISKELAAGKGMLFTRADSEVGDTEYSNIIHRIIIFYFVILYINILKT